MILRPTNKQVRDCWLAWGIIVGYEILAKEDELLSDAFDGLTDKHPIATRLAILYTAAHLANLLPTRYDVFYLAACAQRMLR